MKVIIIELYACSFVQSYVVGGVFNHMPLIKYHFNVKMNETKHACYESMFVFSHFSVRVSGNPYLFFSSLQNKIQSFFNGSHVCSNIKMKNDFVAHNLIMKKDRCKNDTIRRNEMRDFSIQNILTAWTTNNGWADVASDTMVFLARTPYF